MTCYRLVSSTREIESKETLDLDVTVEGVRVHFLKKNNVSDFQRDATDASEM
jgi:hypothetical protein